MDVPKLIVDVFVAAAAKLSSTSLEKLFMLNYELKYTTHRWKNLF
jgi:hypothetical protein